ncbi:4'-phosphopantetheinyl transferase [Alteromonadaceae bacterium 2753L.S.0a.02]|nr:4'-phosphopantetheinyl transferase [Alteromonadaceae bacterium 2753L.S.0a.02]
MPDIYYCSEPNYTPVSELPAAQLFDDEEATRYKRMQARVAARFAQARWMVKSLLAKRLQAPLENIRFAYSENGKPHLPNHPELHFSISHCDDAVAISISDFPSGVDVELIERRRGKLEPPWEKPEVFMHQHTARWLDLVEPADKPQMFTILWTLLESQVKVCDSSITVASRHLEIDIKNHQAPWQLSYRACKALPPVVWQSFLNWGDDAGKRVISVAQLASQATEPVALYDWVSAEPVAVSAIAKS